MLSATKAYICAAFMAWAGTTDTATSWASSITKERNSAVQWESLQIQIGKFVDEYVLTEFDIERTWQEQLEQKLQQKENQMTSRSAGNDDETNAISSPAQQPYSSGSVVILLQKSEDYKVLAVGKVIEVDAHISVPEKHVPVFVASIEECASGKLAPGKVVFWPTDLLAVYKSPTMETAETSQTSNSNLNSNISDIPPGSEEDCYLNYGLQVIQLAMMLMQLNDTEAEGDGDRSLINWKMLLLYFRSRPRGKKYAFEAMRFITCVKGLYTEKIAHRVLHGQFVNPKGGEGSNYANDLKMEHLVGDNKVSLRGLCGNKTLKAVQRCSAAAYGLKECCTQHDDECGIHPESTKHTHACTTEDVKAMSAILQQAKPFHYQRGRTLHSFPTVTKSPLDQLDVALLNTWLTNHKCKLFSGIHDCNEEDNAEENELSDGDENTPEEDD
ncbi:uncharacterized protein [Montipora capricornis]|uniref:uncharacterized protein isoform X4 n=1 Tax=Montipora capricornis TaxID=246305 RepID=UPI0035F140E4